MAKPPMNPNDVFDSRAQAITLLLPFRDMSSVPRPVITHSLRKRWPWSRRKPLFRRPLLSGFLGLQILHTLSVNAAQPRAFHLRPDAGRTAIEAPAPAAGAFAQASTSEAKAEAQTVSVQSIQASMAQAEQRLFNLRAKYTDEYPDVIEAIEQLAELRRELARVSVAQADTVTAAPPLPESTRTSALERTETAPEGPTHEARLQESRSLGHESNRKSMAPQVRQNSPGPTPPISLLPETLKAHSDIEPKPKTTPDAVRPPQTNPSKYLSFIAFIAFSLLAALGTVIIYQRLMRKRRELYISDVATLRSMLAQEFDYVGSIPRMRNG